MRGGKGGRKEGESGAYILHSPVRCIAPNQPKGSTTGSHGNVLLCNVLTPESWFTVCKMNRSMVPLVWRSFSLLNAFPGMVSTTFETPVIISLYSNSEFILLFETKHN